MQHHNELLLTVVERLSDATNLLRIILRERGATGAVRELPVDESFLDRRIVEIDFGLATTKLHWMCFSHFNSLSLNGDYRTTPITTVRDLISHSEDEMLRVYNVGRITTKRIRAVLAAHGLQLRVH
jgi:hypothetical protein